MPSSEVPDIRPMNTVLIRNLRALPSGIRPWGGPAGSWHRRLTRRGPARAASVWATPSWARTLCDSWASCVLAAGVRTMPSEDCATSSGSCCTPSILTSKCRCGPVAQPVWPTAPIVCPCSTSGALDDVDPAQVGVDRRQVVVVLDVDDVAVAVLPAGELDHAVADRAHRRAARRAVVDAVVLLPGVEDRVHAHREARGHARELERAARAASAACSGRRGRSSCPCPRRP